MRSEVITIFIPAHHLDGSRKTIKITWSTWTRRLSSVSGTRPLMSLSYFVAPIWVPHPSPPTSDISRLFFLTALPVMGLDSWLGLKFLVVSWINRVQNSSQAPVAGLSSTRLPEGSLIRTLAPVVWNELCGEGVCDKIEIHKCLTDGCCRASCRAHGAELGSHPCSSFFF